MSHISQLSFNDKVNWIRLVRTKHISRSIFFNLIKIFDNVEDIVNNIEEYSLKGGLKKPIKIHPLNAAKKELEDCYNIDADIVCFNDINYPTILREIPDPPPLITVKGNIDLMEKNIISIVGPRNASLNGCKFAHKIASELGAKGIVIASGLARGIDTAAHKASINSGTIGVIAGGIDNIYPKENTDLYQEMMQKGLLISETPIGMPPRGGNFPQRNRIISGLSLGVVVIEATLRSGTLITSRFALEQNREIFAVPGSPFDPRYEGTNRLIKQGAKLIENSSDILNDIEEIIYSKNRFSNINESFDEEFIGASFKAPDDKIVNEVRELILKKINYTPILDETIIDELDIPVKIANIAFVQLELADKIENKNGKISLKG